MLKKLNEANKYTYKGGNSFKTDLAFLLHSKINELDPLERNSFLLE